MSDAPVTVSAKAKSLLDLVTDRVTEWIPKNLNVWLITLTCLIVLVALSRLMSLQKTVSELQSRPAVDEHLIRQVVRQHLEETVKAMDQQNRLQLQIRQQQMMEQARKAQQALIEKQKEMAAAAAASPPKIEILDEDKASTVQPAEVVKVDPQPDAVKEEVVKREPDVKLEIQDDKKDVAVKVEPAHEEKAPDAASHDNTSSPAAPRVKRHKQKALAV